MQNQSRQEQVAQLLAEHRKGLPDEEWLDYYYDIGFPTQPETTDEERITAAVRFDAAEGAYMPDWYYDEDWSDE